MSAPWSPMVAPPLVCRNDAEFDTCSHGYPAEDCLSGWGRLVAIASSVPAGRAKIRP